MVRRCYCHFTQKRYSRRVERTLLVVYRSLYQSQKLNSHVVISTMMPFSLNHWLTFSIVPPITFQEGSQIRLCPITQRVASQ